MSARDDILARVRAALADPPAAGPTLPPTSPATDVDLIDLLADRLRDYKAAVRVCAPDGAAHAVAELLGDATTAVAPPGLPGAWLSSYNGRVVEDLDRDGLDAPGVATVTTCAVAIAETGTLVLDAGPGQGRRALTLVPDQHVCVVPAERIVAGVPESLSRLEDPTRPLTLVSGPSATSDIELNRVEGVHGPRRLGVVILR